MYFAKDAAYSHIYASKAGTPASPGLDPLAQDEREMMQASLILGRVVVMDRDNVPGMKQRLGGRLNDGSESKLKAPPFLNSAPPLYEGGDVSQGKYDTVAGWTQADMKRPDGTWTKNQKCPRSKVWIVYENGRAYPRAPPDGLSLLPMVSRMLVVSGRRVSRPLLSRRA